MRQAPPSSRIRGGNPCRVCFSLQFHWLRLPRTRDFVSGLQMPKMWSQVLCVSLELLSLPLKAITMVVAGD